MRISRMIVGALILVAFASFRSDTDYVISGDLAFLAGRYELLYTDQGSKATRKYAADLPEKYEIRITKKDQVIFYKNGKKAGKMEVWPGEIPFLDSAQYIAVRKHREVFPIFFSKDKIQVHTFPVEFNDNVFLRVEADE